MVRCITTCSAFPRPQAPYGDERLREHRDGGGADRPRAVGRRGGGGRAGEGGVGWGTSVLVECISAWGAGEVGESAGRVWINLFTNGWLDPIQPLQLWGVHM